MIPPHDLESEKIILNSVINVSGCLDRARETLRSDDFYPAHHQSIFAAIMELCGRNEHIDLYTVHTELTKTEKTEAANVVLELGEGHATATAIDYYIKTLLAKSQLRKLIAVCHDTIAAAYEPDIEADQAIATAQAAILSIECRENKQPYFSTQELLSETFKDIEKFSKNEIIGVASGIEKLDDVTGGFQKGDLIIVAGRPGMGKTAFAITLAIGCAKKSGVVFFVSIEMPNKQIMLRTLCRESMVNMHLLRAGLLAKTEYPKLQNGANVLIDHKIFTTDDTALMVSDIANRSRRLKREQGRLDLVCIDYTQLIKPHGGDSREERVAAISKALKAMAKDLNCPVIALSQLSRQVEQRQEKEPQLSDLRESGAIEQDADLVLFPFRPSVYFKTEIIDKVEVPIDSKKASIIVGKNRNGPTGKVDVSFLDYCMRYDNLETEREAEGSWQG